MQLCLIAYTFIKDMNYHCAKFYTNMSTNMDYTNIFQFLAIFAQKFYYFTKKKLILGPILLRIMAKIVSYIMI